MGNAVRVRIDEADNSLVLVCALHLQRPHGAACPDPVADRNQATRSLMVRVPTPSAAPRLQGFGGSIVHIEGLSDAHGDAVHQDTADGLHVLRSERAQHEAGARDFSLEGHRVSFVPAPVGSDRVLRRLGALTTAINSLNCIRHCYWLNCHRGRLWSLAAIRVLAAVGKPILTAANSTGPEIRSACPAKIPKNFGGLKIIGWPIVSSSCREAILYVFGPHISHRFR